MTFTDEVIAIIPARGGSKGIPLKNIREVNGIPLIGHTIIAALAAETVDRVIVSTDSGAIAEVAEEFGAEVVKRPDAISGDFSSSEEALIHVLMTLAEKENSLPGKVVFLQCTSPLTLAEDIDGTVRKCEDERDDTALSVSPFHYYVWTEDENGEGQGVNHDKRTRLMRQERENQYLENGAIYVMDTERFLKEKFRFFGKTVLYTMPEARCFEIDEPVDLVIVEEMLKWRDRE